MDHAGVTTLRNQRSTSANLTACCTEDTIRPMRMKRMRGWVALLLPAFLLRALIPVGFMPMIGLDHSVRLVICDSYAPVPTSLMDMSMDARMNMSHPAPSDGAGGPPVHQDHGSCPYGSSPALGALPTLAFTPFALQRPATISVAAPQIGYFQALTRAQSPRAPPV
jgi:Protein of unknown function (DUF2946)